MTIDLQEIVRTLRLFTRPDEVGEVRIINGRREGAISIYFAGTEVEEIARRAAELNETAKGVYVVMNRLQHELLERSPRDNNQRQNAREATKDADIVRRQWLLIDFDPHSSERGADDSATEEEKEVARTRMETVREHLREIGFADPVVADSGNGWHLLYRIDLLNDDESRDLVKQFLRALFRLHSDTAVEIDTRLFNASRITKLYGTMARKGQDRPERPHRLSRLVVVPPGLVPVTRGLIEQVANGNDASRIVTVTSPVAEFGLSADLQSQHVQAGPTKSKHEKRHRLNIDDFIERLNGVRYGSSAASASYTALCPAHADGTPSLSITEADDGRILVYCFAGCEFADILRRLGLEPWQLFPPRSSRHATVIQPAPAPAANPTLHALAEQCAAATSDIDLGFLAAQLGVSLASLRCLQVGWSPHYQAWTIPERRPDGWIIGVQLRSPEGHKWMVPGSHRGLILPWGWSHFLGRVYLPEGMSDVAACLSHGLPAIGRSSASGSCELLSQLLMTTALAPVVVGENDLKPDGRWPGREQ